MKNYYEVIGVSANASNEQIRKAYHKKIKQYHPDVFTGDQEICRQITEELNQAYQVLKDSEQRKILDKKYGHYKYKEPKQQSEKSDTPNQNQFLNKLKIKFQQIKDKIKNIFSKSKKKEPKQKKVSDKVTTNKDLLILNIFIYGFLIIAIVLLIVYICI